MTPTSNNYPALPSPQQNKGNHAYDRVLLNVPLPANTRPQMAASHINGSAYNAPLSPSCNTGCNNAQFVLESAQKRY